MMPWVSKNTRTSACDIMLSLEEYSCATPGRCVPFISRTTRTSPCSSVRGTSSSDINSSCSFSPGRMPATSMPMGLPDAAISTSATSAIRAACDTLFKPRYHRAGRVQYVAVAHTGVHRVRRIVAAQMDALLQRLGHAVGVDRLDHLVGRDGQHLKRRVVPAAAMLAHRLHHMMRAHGVGKHRLVGKFLRERNLLHRGGVDDKCGSHLVERREYRRVVADVADDRADTRTLQTQCMMLGLVARVHNRLFALARQALQYRPAQ